jgi:hypothetical protein
MRTFNPKHNVDDAVARAQLLTEHSFLLAYEKETTPEQAREDFWNHLHQAQVGRPLYPCGAKTWADYFQDALDRGIIDVHPAHCLTPEGHSQLATIQRQLVELQIVQ